MDELLREHPLLGLAAMFGGGLVTSLTPCVYPMIPVVAGVLGGAGAAQRSRRLAVVNSLLYALGLALVYATLGMAAGLTGALFGSVSSNPWAYFTMGNLLLIGGLMMLEAVPVPVSRSLLGRAARATGDSRGGVLLMGATSGLVAAPCGAPAFAAALTFVGATGSGVLGFLYLFAFSLGMTALLLAVGLVSGLATALPRGGAWTGWVKRGAGVVLLGMAEYYFVQMGRVS